MNEHEAAIKAGCEAIKQSNQQISDIQKIIEKKREEINALIEAYPRLVKYPVGTILYGEYPGASYPIRYRIDRPSVSSDGVIRYGMTAVYEREQPMTSEIRMTEDMLDSLVSTYEFKLINI